MPRYQSGFSRFEWTLSTITVAILMILFLSRILGLLADVERIRLVQWESRLRSALSSELTHYMLTRQFENIENLHGVNPMSLLDEPPDNYLGERRVLDLTALPDGVWFFDTSRNVLVYTISNVDQFHSTLDGRPRVEYRVVVEYQDRNLNGRFDFGGDHLQALKMVSMAGYQWQSGRQ